MKTLKTNSKIFVASLVLTSALSSAFAVDKCKDLNLQECINHSSQAWFRGHKSLTYTPKSKNEKQKFLQDIENWRKKYPGVWNRTENETASISNTTLNLIKILPPKMVELLSTPEGFYHDGPNCWNSIAYSNNQAIRSYMSSFDDYKKAFCRLKAAHEPLVAGDIGSMESLYDDGTLGKELHAFIYLTDDLAFSKSGPEIEQFYELTTQTKMEAAFGINCFRPETDQKRKQCKTFTDFYECNFSHPFELQKKHEARIYKLGRLIEAAKYRLTMNKITHMSDAADLLTSTDMIKLLEAFYETLFYVLELKQEKNNHYILSLLFDYRGDINSITKNWLQSIRNSKEQQYVFFDQFEEKSFFDCQFDMNERLTYAYYELADPSWHQVYKPLKCTNANLSKFKSYLKNGRWWSSINIE